jgi:hypothetical protein
VDAYDLRNDLLLAEIRDAVMDALRGFGYKLSVDVKISKYHFGEGVELRVSKRGDKAEFQWNGSLRKLFEAEIQSLVKYLILLCFFAAGMILFQWHWSNTLWFVVFAAMTVINALIIVYKIPVSLINSRIHLMKTQLLLRDVIEKYA